MHIPSETRSLAGLLARSEWAVKGKLPKALSQAVDIRGRMLDYCSGLTGMEEKGSVSLEEYRLPLYDLWKSAGSMPYEKPLRLIYYECELLADRLLTTGVVQMSDIAIILLLLEDGKFATALETAGSIGFLDDGMCEADRNLFYRLYTFYVRLRRDVPPTM